MRSTQESGQILRSKKRPRRTLRSGRGSRTNSNTSRQIPAPVIDAAYDTGQRGSGKVDVIVTTGMLEPLRRVNAAGTHLLSLINEILDLSKIEAGKLDLNLEPVNLSRLIDEVIGTAGQL